jgi:hypothetical protein
MSGDKSGAPSLSLLTGVDVASTEVEGPKFPGL